MRDRTNDTAHRDALESKLGRKLTPLEVAHHQDGNKQNNAKANLSPMARGAHTALENSQRPLGLLRKSLSMVKRGEKLY
jgi:hypothetical protein